MTKTTDADYQLAKQFLHEQYQAIVADYPRFATDVDETQYCRVNINAVLTFDRRMQLLRAGRGDIHNAWAPEAIAVIGF